jgi:glycosyltransferase involved in cell wall biosynthesis
VSFIIPAYNEERLLPRALASIREAIAANELDAEVIVADDDSADRTAAIALALGAKVIARHNRQIAATRNMGAEIATGDLLVFVDADSAVSAELVRDTLDAIDAGAVGGGARCDFDGHKPRWARVFMFFVLPVYAFLGLTPGAYIFATRAAFDAVGGFDDRVYGGEEVLLARALRREGKVRIVRSAVLTSGRKLRSHSVFEIFGIMFRLMRSGMKGVRTRDGMDLWYGERRADPDCPVDRG